MDKHLAEELMAIAVETDKLIARMNGVVGRIDDVETKQLFRKAVDDVMGAIARDIIFPIEALYPDLKPDKS